MNLYKDDEKSLTISNSKNVISVNFKNIYGEDVTRKYALVDECDDDEFMEMIQDELNHWGFDDNFYEIVDKIEDYIYSMTI